MSDQKELKKAKELMQRAREARKRSYSPYSSFPVGAAVLAADGTIVTGSNIENASFSLSICAERNAMSTFVHEGLKDPVAIAVAGDNGVECPPCGACRQFLFEFNPEMKVVLDRGNGVRILSLSDLFPCPFGPVFLEGNE